MYSLGPRGRFVKIPLRMLCNDCNYQRCKRLFVLNLYKNHITSVKWSWLRFHRNHSYMLKFIIFISEYQNIYFTFTNSNMWYNWSKALNTSDFKYEDYRVIFHIKKLLRLEMFWLSKLLQNGNKKFRETGACGIPF